ncbi:hypothetical protein AKO1_014373 [Acrasis kona]|uniref:TRP C-terminal domain-containing protein n=1 Tax=Acrasis kona TaxID=1008807 RepID=A0AAW2Z0T6_9EUKA
MDIAATYSPTSRVMIFMSFNQDPADPYLIGTSKRIGDGLEVLHAAITTSGTRTLYVKLCRTTSDRSLVTYSFNVNFHCSETSYATNAGFACTKCPTNSTRPLLTDVTGVESCKCNVDTYKTYTTSSFRCIDCPYGAFCKGGDEQPKPLDGYFPLNNGGVMIYVKCPFANACVHSSRNGTQVAAPIDVNLPVWFPPIPIQQLFNKSITSATTTELCSDGYSGYLCGQCASSYFRLGERCLSCGNQNTSNFLIVLYTLGLIAVFIITIPITVLNTHVSSFGIVINFIQICALFNMFSLKWSDSLQTFFDLLSLSNLNVQLFRPECVTPVGYFAKFMIIIFIPVMYFVVSFVPLITSILCMKFCKMPYFTRKRFVRLLSWTINSWFCFCIIQGYIMLSSWTLSFYSCDNYGKLLTNLPAESKMSRHLWHSSEVCDSNDRAFGGYLFMFWVGLGVYTLGIPFGTLFLWYLLVGLSRWRARRALRSQEKADVKTNSDILGVIGLGLSSTGDLTSNKPAAQQQQTKPTSPDPSSTGSPAETKEEDDKQKKDLLNKLSREIRLSTTSLLVEGRISVPIVSGLENRKDVIRMFGSFYHRYRPRHFYWEVFVVLRKILIVLCFAYLEERPVVAVVLSSFVLLFALVLHLYFQPYRKHTSNILESLLLVFQYCMLVLGLMYYAADGVDADGATSTGYSTAVTTVVTVFIILGLCIGAFVLALELLYEFRRTYYVPIREKMKDQAFRNRAKNVLDTLANRKGATMLREHDDPDSVLNEIEIDDSFDGETVPAPQVQESIEAALDAFEEVPPQPIEMGATETIETTQEEQKPHEFIE